MPEGMKFDNGKLRWSLVPSGVMNEVIGVLEYGAVKYREENWKHVDNAQIRYYDAAMRHIDSWWHGQKIDPETMRHHLAHAICCLMFLMWLDEHELNNLMGAEFK